MISLSPHTALLAVVATFSCATLACGSFNPGGPMSAGCSAAGINCCYSPTWWLQSLGDGKVSCTSGSFSRGGTPSASDVLGECSDAPLTTCVQDVCTTIAPPTCSWNEESGDQITARYAAGPGTCENNNYNGQTINVYSKANFKAGNNEVTWGDVDVPSNEPSEGENCNGGTSSTYTITGTYTHTTGWNIGAQVGAKPPSSLLNTAIQSLSPEIKLTGGYTDTTSKGTNAGVTVTVPTGQHGTITKGTLTHHSYGHWIITSGTVTGPGKMNGCKVVRVDNAGVDIPADASNPDQPGGWGTETKPCGYPTLNGKTE